jgi:hypothetical protein
MSIGFLFGHSVHVRFRSNATVAESVRRVISGEVTCGQELSPLDIPTKSAINVAIDDFGDEHMFVGINSSDTMVFIYCTNRVVHTILVVSTDPAKYRDSLFFLCCDHVKFEKFNNLMKVRG